MKQKVSFVCHWTKGLQRKAEFFCIRYFWRTKRKLTETITERCFSCQKKSVCQKLARSCKKWKSAKKAIHALFARRPSIRKTTDEVYLIYSKCCREALSKVTRIAKITKFTIIRQTTQNINEIYSKGYRKSYRKLRELWKLRNLQKLRNLR